MYVLSELMMYYLIMSLNSSFNRGVKISENRPLFVFWRGGPSRIIGKPRVIVAVGCSQSLPDAPRNIGQRLCVESNCVNSVCLCP